MNDTNCPVQIPNFTHNGDCNLICKPADWKDLLVFFLGNYGAHAATVIGRPGQSSLTRAFSLVLALFFPGAGVLTGITAIASLALFAPTELTKAARAGALCIVVKAGECPGTTGEDVEALNQQPSSSGRITPSRDSEHRAADLQRTASGDEANPLTMPRPEGPGRSPQQEDGASSAGDYSEQHALAGEGDDSVQSIPQPRLDSIHLRSDEGVQGTMTERRSPPEASETLDGQADEVIPSSVAASQVHGIARLPAGYRLLVLPGWTTFEHDDDELNEKSSTVSPPESFGGRVLARACSPFKSQSKLDGTVPCSYNAIKALISIGQLLFSVLTLYETRGNQLAVYGYAAFGLTVAPYFWMSLVNLVGNLMCPQYPNIFIVNSPTLDRLRTEVEDKGLAHRYPFDGTVGRISDATEARVLGANGHLLQYTTALEIFFNRIDPEKSPETWTLVSQAIAAYVVAAVPIAIVGGLSRFDPGQSAAYQRVWTTIWLCLGPVVGIGYGMWVLPLFESWPVLWRTMMIRKADELSERALVPTSHDGKERGGDRDAESRDDAPKVVIWIQLARFALAAGFISMYMAPAIGGFVVVAQMLMQYGTCNKLS